MSDAERELLVCRITSGLHRLKIGSQSYYLRGPSSLERYQAGLLYEEALEQSLEDPEVMTDEEALLLLAEKELWTLEDAVKLEGIEKDIENLKVGIFQCLCKSRERELGKKALGVARQKQHELYGMKHQFDHTTASGLAFQKKMKYLWGVCLLDSHRREVWPKEEFWRDNSTLLDDVVRAVEKTRVTETQYRELARKEPWRSLWACKGAEGNIFGRPACELTDEQRNLILWTRLYDSAFENPECPAEEVLEDDDMFDGWLILQKRQRDEEKKERGSKLTGNDKIDKADEVFHIAETEEDIKRVNAMNSPQAAATKKVRENFLAKQGVVQEAQMPDSRQKILMQFNNGLK